jgi:glycine betaine/choline ABC-type transport system substrate-binding protein
MSRSLRALLALLAVFVLAVGVTACGDDEEDGGSGQSGGQAQDGGQAPGQEITADPANKGKRITIGSKNFAEQYILGEIYAQALKAAGFNVKKELDLGAEQVAFKALKNGTVDAYPEYTGTALTSFYKVKTDDVPRDKDQAFEQLQEELKADKITGMPLTPFENTFRVTSTVKTKEELGNPTTLTEVAEKAGSSKSISGFPECRQRTDCHLGLKQKYGWSPKFVSSEGKFEDLDAGQADFTFGFSTDGELTLTDKYATYEDDKKLFPPYQVTLLTRNEAMERLGESGRRVIEQIQAPLTEQVMQELNSRVTLDKQQPEDVARAYLKESGFIK